MFFNRNIKYRDILIFALIGLIGYKLIDNYKIFFNFFDVLNIQTPPLTKKRTSIILLVPVLIIIFFNFSSH